MRAAVLALAVGAASLILLPFVPLLPGLGSTAGLLLGLLSYRKAQRRWVAVAAVAVGGLGVALALIQALTALVSLLIGPA